jgi:hypothetical protein
MRLPANLESRVLKIHYKRKYGVKRNWTHTWQTNDLAKKIIACRIYFNRGGILGLKIGAFSRNGFTNLVRCNSKYKMNKESFTSAESWKFFSKRFK